MPEESELSLALDGGIVTTAIDDVIGPPSLRESDNTRLSVLRGTLTAAPAPVTLATVTGGAECGGIVPAGQVDSAVVFFHGGGGYTRRVAGDDIGVLQSVLQPPATQNGYQPVEIARAGVIPGTLEPRPPVVCVHDGVRVFASVRPNPLVAGDVGIFITAMDADGKVVLTPHFACSIGVESPLFALQATEWVGLTDHGSSGIRLWYTRAGHVRRRTLTITALELAVGTEVDHAITDSVIGYQLDVCSDGAGFAYLVHRIALPASVLDKVDIVADTFSRITLTSIAGGPVACSYLSTPSFPYVAVTFESAAQWYKAVFRADTFANVWHTLTSPSAASDETAVQFLVEPDGTSFAVFAITKNGDLSSLSPGFVLFQACDLFTGTIALVGRKNTNWMRLADRGATVVLNAVERVPVFTLARNYNYEEAADIESINYLSDPSRELYLVTRGVPGFLHLTPVARFGVDIALRGQSPLGAFTAFLGSNTCCIDPSHASRRVVITYLAENYELTRSAIGHVPRFVEVDFTPKQPRYAVDAYGVALIAAAQPATWDGMEVVEAGPLHRPQIRVYDSGGTGDDLTGTFIFRAVVSWRDAGGRLHRSAPSLPGVAVGSPGPIKPRVYVTIADTLRQGLSQEEFDITIYQAGPLVGTADEVDDSMGSDYWSRTDYAPVSKTEVWEFSIITEDPPDDSTLIYSTGAPDEELVPEAPPPFWDAATVGLRTWGINAELRRRVHFSKKTAEGIATEWNGTLYADMPAASGDLIAVTELDGKPLFFGEHAIYIIDGEGPDNLGDGFYGDPRCLATIACSSKESVVRFPGGVMFQSGARFVIMQSGGACQYVDEIDASVITDMAAAVVLTRGQEVVFVPRTASVERAHVYNYALNRWTTWSSWPLFAAFAMVTRTRALGFHYAGAALKSIDVDEPGATTVVTETGWVQPAGPQGNCNVRPPIIQGVWAAGYTLRVKVLLDFNETTPAFDETFTAQQILDACDGKTRFTLKTDLVLPIARAIRLRTEAISSSSAAVQFKPVAVTIPLGISPGQLRRHVAAGMK